MSEDQVRRATAAGITDAVRSLCNAALLIVCVITFVLHPVAGILLLLAGVFVVLPLWGAWEAITRPARERRETGAAKQRARAYWKMRGYTDLDITGWEATDTTWWHVGKRYPGDAT